MLSVDREREADAWREGLTINAPGEKSLCAYRTSRSRGAFETCPMEMRPLSHHSHWYVCSVLYVSYLKLMNFGYHSFYGLLIEIVSALA